MIEETDEQNVNIDLTGKTVAGFHVLRRLGRGGMADVYLARQESLQRNVALKILKPELARDASYIERFNREAQSAAKLVQANIVGVYEVGEIDGLHYIAQEYVVGRNLREYLARNGAAKPVMVINVLRQVGLALQKADEHNVTHRDIKPENIMLSPGGEVKVADFGLARVDDGKDKHLTQVGITMGTPLYMSPEQVEGQKADVRSDIYSLGVTAYHMLAGQPPFDAENAMAIAVQHVKDEPDPLTGIRPDASPELLKLVHQMMAKSPKDRPQNPGQLLKQVKNIKIDMDEDWEQLVETLAIENTQRNTIPVSESRLAVTRQLQSLMKGNVRSWWTELSTILTLILLAVAGIAAGLLIANLYPADNLLGVAIRDQSNIEKMDSVKDQYEFAIDSHPNEIDYYQAVLDHFPGDGTSQNQTRLYHNRAKERMAELYLLQAKYAEAEKIYEEFTSVTSPPRFPIVGHAGLAVASYKQDQADRAKQEIVQVESKVKGNLNRFLLRNFDEAREFYFAAPDQNPAAANFTE